MKDDLPGFRMEDNTVTKNLRSRISLESQWVSRLANRARGCIMTEIRDTLFVLGFVMLACCIIITIPFYLIRYEIRELKKTLEGMK